MGIDYLDKYNQWTEFSHLDEELKQELQAIKGDRQKIEDRFYKDLEFGTGGLRGIIGAGTNRMNIYVVARATQGLADYINQNDKKGPSVVIAYDSRNKSAEFSKIAALTLAANGIKAYVFEALRPTPELSFAVRELKATAGIVITASHNPPEYNGYKVYDEFGGQIIPEKANVILSYIEAIEDLFYISELDEEEAIVRGLLQYIGTDIDNKYLSRVKALSRTDIGNKNIKIVYTPLHGSGKQLIESALRESGYQNLHLVKEQSDPDPNFTYAKRPNPEEKEALHLAIKYAAELRADIVIGTDPDCDRVGAAVRDHDDRYILLNGNQIGALLLNYILETDHRYSSKDVLIKTIVTSDLGRCIANDYGLMTIDVLTGFKYIGEQINIFERTKEHQFVFGYEESYGYLTGDFVRDKDAVIASFLICEMAAYYKNKDHLTLIEKLEQIYEKYGYFEEKLVTISFEGKDGLEKMKQIMRDIRSKEKAEKCKESGLEIEKIEDYERSEAYHFIKKKAYTLTLPQSDVIKYHFSNGCWAALRPSGTEPKLKVYISAQAGNRQKALGLANNIENAVKSWII